MREGFNLGNHIEEKIRKEDISLDHDSTDDLVMKLKENPHDTKFREELVMRTKRIVEKEINTFFSTRRISDFGYSSPEQLKEDFASEMYIMILNDYQKWDSKEDRENSDQKGHTRFANFITKRIRWRLDELVRRKKVKKMSGLTEDADEAMDNPGLINLSSFVSEESKKFNLVNDISDRKLAGEFITELIDHDPIQGMIMIALYGLGGAFFDTAFEKYQSNLKSGMKSGYNNKRYQNIIPKLREFALIPEGGEGKQIAEATGLSAAGVSLLRIKALDFLKSITDTDEKM